MEVAVILLMAIIATEAITELVVSSQIFFPIRDWLGGTKFIGYMINCGYCFSVWVSLFIAFAASYIYNINILFFALLWMFIHRMSNIFHNIVKIFENKSGDNKLNV